MALATRMSFAVGGFRYLGKEYLFADVRHVDWWHEQKTEANRKGQHVTIYSAKLAVILANGKVVKITNVSQISATNTTTRKDVHDVMAEAAKKLLERSFDTRMDAYEQNMATRGYVKWGAHQLTQHGELYWRFAYCFTLDNSKVRCMMYPFRLVCWRRPRRWWNRLLQPFMFNNETINLERDRDCFLYLMRKYARIYWETETIPLHRGVGADGRKPRAEADAATGEDIPSPNDKGTSQTEAPWQEDAKVPPPPPPPPPKPRLGVEHYMGILAVPVGSEWAVVKAEYRGLVKRYHPDLMRGRGANDAELKQAEDTLKTINEAFGWLEDYYRLKPR